MLLNFDDQILRFLLCIPVSTADAATVNPNGIKTLLAFGLITVWFNSLMLILFLVMDQ